LYFVQSTTAILVPGHHSNYIVHTHGQVKARHAEVSHSGVREGLSNGLVKAAPDVVSHTDQDFDVQ